MSNRSILLLWGALALLMSANGVFRELVLKPRLGAPPADVVSAALGITIILLTTAFAMRPLAHAATSRLIGISLVLVVLTIGFELVMGRAVDHKSWAELAGNYAIWRGRLWPVVLGALAVTPFLWGRWVTAVR